MDIKTAILLLEPVFVGLLFVLSLVVVATETLWLAGPTIGLGICLVLWAVAPRPRFVDGTTK